MNRTSTKTDRLEKHFNRLERIMEGDTFSFHAPGGSTLFHLDAGAKTVRVEGGGEFPELIAVLPCLPGEKDPVIPLDDIENVDSVIELIEAVERKAGADIARESRWFSSIFPTAGFMKRLIIVAIGILIVSFLVMSYTLARHAVVNDREISIRTLLNR